MLVDTYSTMIWSEPANNPVGSADNGLNSPVTLSSSPPTQYGGMRGEKFTVMDGSQGVISFSVAVSANASGTMNAYGSSVVGVSRSLNVSVNSIWLRVEGTTLDASKQNNILIGQECKAGVFTSVPGATLQNYQWSVSGDVYTTFWVSSDSQHGHMIACDPAIWSGSDPAWTWRDANDAGALNDTKTVQVSADVYVNGQFIATVQDSLFVTVWAPYSKMTATPASPTSVNFESGQSGVQAQGPKGEPGIEFFGSVGTPDLFISGGNTGRWCYVQLLWLDRVQYVFSSPIGYATSCSSALDDVFPYVLASYPDYYPADSQSNVHTEGKEEDSPSSGFISYIRSFAVNDTYRMWMLYVPPGGQFVPIQSLRWHWNTTGTRDWSSPPQPFSPDPPQGSVTSDGGHADTIFPYWDTIFASSQ